MNFELVGANSLRVLQCTTLTRILEYEKHVSVRFSLGLSISRPSGRSLGCGLLREGSFMCLVGLVSGEIVVKRAPWCFLLGLENRCWLRDGMVNLLRCLQVTVVGQDFGTWAIPPDSALFGSPRVDKYVDSTLTITGASHRLVRGTSQTLVVLLRTDLQK